MIVSIDEVKEFLKIEKNNTDEDLLIQTLINAAEEYLKNATGNTFDNTNNLARLFCMILISDWYENREFIGKTSEKVRDTINSMVTQLKYCYGGETS